MADRAQPKMYNSSGTGKPFTIHTSINTVELLRQHEGLFKIVERVGKVTLKNRGEHQTYFVVGELVRVLLTL